MWFLSPALNTSNSCYRMSKIGHVGKQNNAYMNSYVIPSLYLKSNVSITGGVGSEKNPFVLG